MATKPDIRLIQHIHANRKVFEPYLEYLSTTFLENSIVMKDIEPEIPLRHMQGRNKQLREEIDFLNNTDELLSKLLKR